MSVLSVLYANSRSRDLRVTSANSRQEVDISEESRKDETSVLIYPCFGHLTNVPTDKKRGGRKSEDNSDDNYEEENAGLSVTRFSHARAGAIQHISDSESSAGEEKEGEEEDTFIIEDDSENVHLELPPEFSMNTYQDLTHHFKIICQLFVHLAVLEKQDRADFMEQASKGLQVRIS